MFCLYSSGSNRMCHVLPLPPSRQSGYCSRLLLYARYSAPRVFLVPRRFECTLSIRVFVQSYACIYVCMYCIMSSVARAIRWIFESTAFWFFFKQQYLYVCIYVCRPMYVCMYVWMYVQYVQYVCLITFSRLGINRVRLPILHRSRETGLDHRVPRQPAHSPHPGWIC